MGISMKHIVDGIALLVILVCAISSAKKGFVNCVFGLISVLAAILVAFLLMNSVVELTGGMFGLREATTRGVTNALSEMEIFATDFSVNGIREQLNGKLPDFVIDLIIDNYADKTIPEGMTLAVAVGETVGKLAATLVAWFVIFLIVRILLNLLRKVINSVVENLPLVGALNKLLGLAVGLLQGLFIISAVVALVSLIPTEGIVSIFNETVFVKMIYNQNPITVLMSKFM